jgi:pyridoxine 5-phosphate synthase
MRKKLGVNIDHVATVRQARLGTAPDPVTAAGIAELSGADGITVHLREDRRHIQDRDVEILKQVVQTRINLEMAATDEMVGIAKAIRPFSSTIVPEKREEVTTEGGLDVLSQRESLHETVSRLQEAGIFVSLFIDPDLGQVRAAKQAGADAVEIHTGTYCVAFQAGTFAREFEKIRVAATHGRLPDTASTCETSSRSFPFRKSRSSTSATASSRGRCSWASGRRSGRWPT